MNSKKIFLVDAIGAILSAFLLGVVLTKYESYFGIPKSSLYFLAFLPCCFAIYDLYCYYLIDSNWTYYLTGIAIVNLLYCGVSLGFGVYHHNVITPLGWAYIIIEIIIVVGVSLIELRVAKQK